LLKRVPFNELSLPTFPTPKKRTRLHTPQFGTPAPKSEKIPASSKWPGGHKSNAESRHIYLVSFQFTSNLIVAVKPTQSSSLLAKFPVYTFVTTCVNIHYDTRPLKTRMVTLPSLQTEPRQGPYRHLASTTLFWMKLEYTCLDSALDLWPPGHFELGYFCFSARAFRVRFWKVWWNSLLQDVLFLLLLLLFFVCLFVLFCFYCWPEVLGGQTSGMWRIKRIWWMSCFQHRLTCYSVVKRSFSWFLKDTSIGLQHRDIIARSCKICAQKCRPHLGGGGWERSK